jgi:hypothetical protein
MRSTKNRTVPASESTGLVSVGQSHVVAASRKDDSCRTSSGSVVHEMTAPVREYTYTYTYCVRLCRRQAMSTKGLDRPKAHGETVCCKTISILDSFARPLIPA